MEIRVKNDGKQKAQSCEASVQIFENGGWGHFNAEFEGYGANEWSAKQNLIEQVDRLIAELNKLKYENK